MFDYAAYAQQLRQELHMYPEIGFDLPKTLAVVRRELDAMGIPYTEKFGRSSIVGTINEEKAQFTIGIRADMDALPIQELNDVPYKSRIDGQMHACGHDVHTAILLATARQLLDRKDEIRCRIKLLFTPAEEYIEPGCKELAENGVMDDIDCALALHINSGMPVGTIGINPGDMGANSTGFSVDFYGKTAHAISQHKAVDAIMMAMEAVNAMQMMNAKEVPPTKARMLNIGSFHGGSSNNNICDHVQILGSCRTYDDNTSDFMERRLQEISETVATMYGGRADFKITKRLPYRINNDILTKKLRQTAEKTLGGENILIKNRTMGGEDFGYLSRKKPCLYFWLGVRPLGLTSYPAAHTARFDVDPGCFDPAIRLFTQFVLDNMDGIEF